MANTQYIIERENKIIEAKEAVVELIQAIQVDIENENDDPNVHDCYGTAKVNLEQLESVCKEALKMLEGWL